MNTFSPSPLATPHIFRVEPEEAGTRVDTFLTKKMPLYSRSFYQKVLEGAGTITINDVPVTKPSQSVRHGDVITVTLATVAAPGTAKPLTRDLGIKIMYEHEQFFIIYKPAGVLSHAPTATSPEATLVDWLLTHHKDLAHVGSPERPGIVHRLDKDTSGLMIIARTPQAHAHFGSLFQNRLIKKTYRALVQGTPKNTGTINFSIDHHPTHTKMMAVEPWTSRGRTATSHYQVIEQFADCALIEIIPITGRTHQIRVHCAAIGHPVLGDALYGKKDARISRHALHATSLSFSYHETPFFFTSEPPEDFANLINHLQIENKSSALTSNQ